MDDNKNVTIKYNHNLVAVFEEILMSLTDDEFEYTKMLVSQIELRRNFVKNLHD